MTTLDDWTRLAAEIKPRTEIFINGRFPAGDVRRDVRLGEPRHRGLDRPGIVGRRRRRRRRRSFCARGVRGGLVVADLGQAIARSVLQRLAELITEHSQELALLDSMDMGKLVEEAHNVDVPSAADLFAFYGEAIDKHRRRDRPHRTRQPRLGDPRAAGRRRRRHTMELPAGPRGLEGRARAGRRQQRGAQTR